MANECLQVLRPGPAALHGQRRCICGARHHSVAVEGGQAKAAEAAGCDTVGEFLSPLIKDGQAKAAEAAGCETASEHKQACRRANLPLPGAGVSCALVCCRFLQVRGLTVSLSQVQQCPKSADCARKDLYSKTGLHLGPCSVRLSVGNPGLAAEWHPTKNGELRPFDFAAGSSREKAWWAGSCGHEWEAAIGNRYRGAGCQECRCNGYQKK